LASDVDNVVLKALRKDPRPRCASAEQFALGTDYADEPAEVAREIAACTPSGSVQP
jgi:hypothetical protein